MVKGRSVPTISSMNMTAVGKVSIRVVVPVTVALTGTPSAVRPLAVMLPVLMVASVTVTPASVVR